MCLVPSLYAKGSGPVPNPGCPGSGHILLGTLLIGRTGPRGCLLMIGSPWLPQAATAQCRDLGHEIRLRRRIEGYYIYYIVNYIPFQYHGINRVGIKGYYY